jgi:CRP-like cAMP-binding protein
MVRKLSARSPLSEADRQAILALPHVVRTLEASSYTVREGDPPIHCQLLLSGYAYRQKLTGDGARQILAVHIPGDMLDLQNLFLEVSDHNVQMLVRGDVVFIPRPDIQQLARDFPAVGHAMFIDTLIDASVFREWVVNVGRRDSRSRLAHLLCEFGIRLEAAGLTEGEGYELPMTQEQLADAVGLTSVHVNRTLKALAAEGLIERNKRNVSFPDLKRMRQVGDFSERYLHLAQGRVAEPA